MNNFTFTLECTLNGEETDKAAHDLAQPITSARILSTSAVALPCLDNSLAGSYRL